jgi:hypothetical protein
LVFQDGSTSQTIRIHRAQCNYWVYFSFLGGGGGGGLGMLGTCLSGRGCFVGGFGVGVGGFGVGVGGFGVGVGGFGVGVGGFSLFICYLLFRN